MRVWRPSRRPSPAPSRRAGWRRGRGSVSSCRTGRSGSRPPSACGARAVSSCRSARSAARARWRTASRTPRCACWSRCGAFSATTTWPGSRRARRGCRRSARWCGSRRRGRAAPSIWPRSARRARRSRPPSRPTTRRRSSSLPGRRRSRRAWSTCTGRSAERRRRSPPSSALRRRTAPGATCRSSSPAAWWRSCWRRSRAAGPHGRPGGGPAAAGGGRGEIYVRGPTLFAHYYRHPPAECFDAEGFFHTGDLGQLDERGALHFLGRLKDVIKTAGVNVAAAEVEAALLAHPAVGAAHVVGVPDPARGENVAAFVVAKSAVAAEELLAHCRARLSSYKVPRHLWLRREDELPEKASGKVDKAALRAEAARLVRAGGDRPATPPAPRA